MVITVVIMLILAAVGITTGISSYESAKAVQFVSEMKLIQGKVDDFLVEYNTEEKMMNRVEEVGLEIGIEIKELTASQQAKIQENKSVLGVNGEVEEFLYFSIEAVETLFELNNLKETEGFFINIGTREIVSVTGTKYKGYTYYTQYNKNLPGGQTLVEFDASSLSNPNFEITGVENFGLNAKIEFYDINLMGGSLMYELNGDIGVVINSTPKDGNYKMPISMPGKYTFYIKKEEEIVTSFQYCTIELHNKPKVPRSFTPIYYDGTPVQSGEITAGLWYNYEDLLYGWAGYNWAYAEDSGGTMYVWIPRIALNGDEFEYIKGITNVTTKNEGLSDDYSVDEIFSSGDAKLTGIWVDADNIEDLSLITVLEEAIDGIRAVEK